jgi:D-alanyl-D-alanine carboxypeptidase
MRPGRRPVIAVALAVAAVGGWLALPSSAAPVETPATITTGPAAATAAPAPTAQASAARPSPAEALASPAASARPPRTTGELVGSTPPSIPHQGVTTATPMLRAALDARLAALRARTGIPGISVAIVFPDGTTWRGTSGLADVAGARKVTPDTAFPVASVSKTFTAALILGLVQDGSLDLDTSARSYLPTLPIDPAITIRELLDHTSGLRDFFFGAGVDHALLSKPARVWDPARSLKYVGKPYAKPGLSWHYSNTNYLVLGMIAEAVGHDTVADQLRARFLGPLGLDHTYYQAAEAPRGPVVHDYRFLGTSPKLAAIDLSDGTAVVPFTSVVTAAGAAGSIATTATDLAHWAQALYAGSALDRSTRDAMVDDALRTAKLKAAIGYGLGVQEVAVDGIPTLGHSGRYLGARAVVRWLPAQRMSIAVLTNQSRTDVNPIAASLLKLALTPQRDCTTCANLP